MSIQSIKEIKKYILALVEEYSTTNMYISDDEDINKKLLPLIHMQYIYLANQEGLRRKKIINVSDNTSNEKEYTPYSLGSSCSKLLGVRVIDSKTNEIEYYYLNKRLYIRNDFYGVIEAEYRIYAEDLTEIAEKDIDDTELDLSQDTVMALCYLVAGDILKTDVSANYSAFDTKAEQYIGALDISKSDIIGVVRPMGFGGGL